MIHPTGIVASTRRFCHFRKVLRADVLVDFDAVLSRLLHRVLPQSEAGLEGVEVCMISL